MYFIVQKSWQVEAVWHPWCVHWWSRWKKEWGARSWGTGLCQVPRPCHSDAWPWPWKKNQTDGGSAAPIFQKGKRAGGLWVQQHLWSHNQFDAHLSQFSLQFRYFDSRISCRGVELRPSFTSLDFIVITVSCSAAPGFLFICRQSVGQKWVETDGQFFIACKSLKRSSSTSFLWDQRFCNEWNYQII